MNNETSLNQALDHVDDLLTQALDYIAALEAAGHEVSRENGWGPARTVWNEVRANKPHELVLACEERKKKQG